MEKSFLNDIKVVIKSIVVSYPNKITLNILNRSFYESEGYNIPYEKLGFCSLEAFIRSLSDIIEVLGNGQSAILKTINNKKTVHIEDFVLNQKKTCGNKFHRGSNSNGQNYKQLRRNKSKHCLTNTQKVSTNFKVLDAPDVNYNIVSNVKQNSFRSNESLHSNQKRNRNLIGQCVSLKSILQSTNSFYENTFDKKLHIVVNNFGKVDISKAISSFETLQEQPGDKKNMFHTSVHCNDFTEAIPEFVTNNLIFRVDAPNNIVKFGTKINPYMLKKDIKINSITPIFITEIHNPYKFWFHFYKRNCELDTLMESIEEFYGLLEPEEFLIPETLIIPGQICATLYKNEWYRAEIIEHISNKRVKVFLVDYATVPNVHVSSIKYLASKFSILPKQAIRGCLSHVKPNGQYWNMHASNYFSSIACNKVLFAKISEINEEYCVYYMVICDTNCGQPNQINKKLISDGYAIYDERW